LLGLFSLFFGVRLTCRSTTFSLSAFTEGLLQWNRLFARVVWIFSVFSSLPPLAFTSISSEVFPLGLGFFPPFSWKCFFFLFLVTHRAFSSGHPLPGEGPFPKGCLSFSPVSDFSVDPSCVPLLPVVSCPFFFFLHLFLLAPSPTGYFPSSFSFFAFSTWWTLIYDPWFCLFVPF